MQISRNDLRRSGRNSAIGTSRMSGGTGNTELSAKAIAPRAQRLWRWCAHAAARPIQPPRVIEASIVLPVWRGPVGRRPATMRRAALPECNWCRGFRKQPFGLACHRPLEIGRADASTYPNSDRREEMMRGLMSERPLLISGILQHAANFHADTEIVSRLVDGTIHRYAYADAEHRSRQLAQALLRLGIEPGDRVGTMAWNTFRHFELYYAISGIGAVCHTINPRLLPEQIAYIVNHAQDRLLFVDTSFIPLIEKLRPQFPPDCRIVLLDEAEAPFPVLAPHDALVDAENGAFAG